MQIRTAAVPHGRYIGTRECSNVKPLRLHDTVKRSECGVCSNSDATHRCRFATHSFNGYRCCPIPPFAQTSFVKSFASSLHSHVASKHRCCIDYTRCAVRRGTNSIPPMTAAAALLSSFVRAVLTWRHRTVTSTRQAGRRHFFGGIATNCLNNSKSAPLSPSSSPLCTASSSPFNRLRRCLWVRGCGLWFLTCEPITSKRAKRISPHIAYSEKCQIVILCKYTSAVGGLYRR